MAFKPSQLAEMKAEVEWQGYTFEHGAGGWNAVMASECLLLKAQPTIERCIVESYEAVFLNDGRVRKNQAEVLRAASG